MNIKGENYKKVENKYVEVKVSLIYSFQIVM